MTKLAKKSDYEELDIRDFSDLNQSFELSNHFVEKHYLNHLTEHDVVPIPEHIQELSIMNNVRLFRIGKLMYDKKENTLDKLSSVYNALGNIGGSVVMIVENDGEQTNLYVGTKTNSKEQSVTPSKN